MSTAPRSGTGPRDRGRRSGRLADDTLEVGRRRRRNVPRRRSRGAQGGAPSSRRQAGSRRRSRPGALEWSARSCPRAARPPARAGRPPRRGRHAELLGLRQLGAGVLAGDQVVGLARHRSAGLATGGPDRLLGLLAVKPVERAGHDERLAGQRAGARAAAAEAPEARARRRRRPGRRGRRAVPVGETAGEARGDGRADALDLLEPLRRIARGLAQESPRGRASRPDRPSARRRSAAAARRASAARSIAVVQPTCGMPSAAMIRSSGRRRERWIAAYRFSALLRANRSSDSRSSTVSR